MFGLFKKKNNNFKSSNISDRENVVVKKDKEWFILETNSYAVELIKSVFPTFNEDGLKDEVISFLNVYMMYLESRDDKYLSYFLCTDEVKDNLIALIDAATVKHNYSNVEFRDFAITGAEHNEDRFVITTEVSVFSINIGSVTIGGSPIDIPVRKIYTVDYTVYKDKFNCCLDCNKVLEGTECECGGTNIKELNKKLISRIEVKDGGKHC